MLLSRCASLRTAAVRAAHPLSRGLSRSAAVGALSASSANTGNASPNQSTATATTWLWRAAASVVALTAASGVVVAHAEAKPKPEDKKPEDRNPPTYLDQPNVDDPHIDRSTGLRFSKKISVETDSKLNNIHTLVGTGCKYKYGVVKLYAVGLYLPPGYAKPSGTDDAVLFPVLNGDVSGTLVIRMHRETELRDFLAHLEEALRTNVKALARDQEKANIAVNLLRDMIIGGADSGTLSRGSSLMFVREGDKIWIRAQGNKIGCIQNDDLARALFTAFLGDNPLSVEAKAAFGKGIKGDKYNL